MSCDFFYIGEWGDKSLYDHQELEEQRLGVMWRGFEQEEFWKKK